MVYRGGMGRLFGGGFGNLSVFFLFNRVLAALIDVHRHVAASFKLLSSAVQPLRKKLSWRGQRSEMVG
jgi:hypothetical protein